MRKQWFGDSRDYVKWSCVRKEAGAELAVVYGPMLREDSFSGEGLDLEVVRFFDKHKDFQAISELFPAGFSYLPEMYAVSDSAQYFLKLAHLISETQKHSKVLVFLDPDTGIEPRKPKNEHLRKSDIKRVCKQLCAGEKLVVYQHASRESDWQGTWFAKLTPLAAETHTALSAPYCEPGTAKDVCFFTFTKR